MTTSSSKPLPPDQFQGWVRNRVPSRDKAEDLRRIALYLDEHDDAQTSEDAKLLQGIADFLLSLRQAAKGGERETPGTRQWRSAEPDGWFIAHHRMGPTCYFGPFATSDEAMAWLDEHPSVMGVLYPAYLTVDWNRR